MKKIRNIDIARENGIVIPIGITVTDYQTSGWWIIMPSVKHTEGIPINGVGTGIKSKKI